MIEEPFNWRDLLSKLDGAPLCIPYNCRTASPIEYEAIFDEKNGLISVRPEVIKLRKMTRK